MAIELEGLEFQIEAESTNANKSIDTLVNSFNKLKNATKSLKGLEDTTGKFGKLNSALAGFHVDKIEKLSNSLQSLSSVGKIKISPDIAERISDIASACKQLNSNDLAHLEKLGNALKSISGAKIKTPKVKAETEDTKAAPSDNMVAATSDISQASSQVQQFSGNLSGAIGQANLLKSVLSGIGGAFKKDLSKSDVFANSLSDVDILKMKLKAASAEMQKLMDSGKTDTTHFANMAQQVRKLSKELSNATVNKNVFTKGWHIITHPLKTLGKAASGATSKIKQLIKAAAKLPVMFGVNFAAKVKQTTSSLAQFLSSIKRIAMYRAIRTMLSALTQGFREGINNLYQYSLMMGGTFAGSMDRLATSSLYLRNSLGAMAAPIINALAPAIDFVIDKIVTLLNYINMLFARLSGANSFTAAKKTAAEFGKAVGGVGSSAKKAAKEIRDATLGIDELNIIMQKDTSSGGGGAGGADYGSMFEELPIDNNISKFADRLKEAFENSDWKTLGGLVGEKINFLFKNIKAERIGKKLGNIINSGVQIAYYTLDSTNFKLIGNQISKFLNGTLKTIDFKIVGAMVVKPTTSLIDMLIGLFKGLDFGLVAQDISDFFIGIYDELTKWLNSHDWEQIGEDLWTKISDFFSNVKIGDVVKSFFRFLGSLWRAEFLLLKGIIKGMFKEIGDNIGKWFDENVKGKTLPEIGLNILKGIGKGLIGIPLWIFENIIDPFMGALLGETWDDIKGVGDKILGKVKDGWDAACGLAENIGEFLVNVKDDSVNWWTNVGNWWDEKAKLGLEVKIRIENKMKKWWDRVSGWWKEVVGNLWTTLQIKLPKVNVTWGKDPVFGKIDIPSFNVQWNAKGGILDGAQLFGMMGNTFLGGGEAGKEAVLPLEQHTEWMDTLADKVRDRTDNKPNSDLSQVISHLRTLEESIERMAEDMKRQADKPETTTVQIGNKTVTDVITTQQKADGYRFAT